MKYVRCLSLAVLAATAGGSALAQTASAFAGRTLEDGQMQVGRYTTTGAEPSGQAGRPLEVYVQINFPRQLVRTVGEAIEHTLSRAGYRLADAAGLAPEAARFLSLPLPESQRSLGPYRVRTVLEVLTGDGWQWFEDPVSRQVWFTARSAPAPAAAARPASSAVAEPLSRPATAQAAMPAPASQPVARIEQPARARSICKAPPRPAADRRQRPSPVEVAFMTGIPLSRAIEQARGR
ncbi:MAG: hypothetical protein FWG56_08225 [Desulfovibrionaceae bacterium]|nr:hypothetical protein [Desulfovibrionaceae bacterium]